MLSWPLSRMRHVESSRNLFRHWQQGMLLMIGRNVVIKLLISFFSNKHYLLIIAHHSVCCSDAYLEKSNWRVKWIMRLVIQTTFTRRSPTNCFRRSSISLHLKQLRSTQTRLLTSSIKNLSENSSTLPRRANDSLHCARANHNIVFQGASVVTEIKAEHRKL